MTMAGARHRRPRAKRFWILGSRTRERDAPLGAAGQPGCICDPRYLDIGAYDEACPATVHDRS